MDDLTALALNGFQEANLEPDDGFAAVCQVVLNRARIRYQCPDGTIQGAIFFPIAFSWTGFEMVNGKYTRVAFTIEEEQARAEDLLARAEMYHTAWARALRIAAAVENGSYHGADFDKITTDTVLYYNPAIVHGAPPWANPLALVATIGHHEFFRA